MRLHPSRTTGSLNTLALVASFAGGLVLSAGVATAQQPNMQNALASLQNARASLLQATPNKGGHRERALTLIDQAINQVQLGISFAAN